MPGSPTPKADQLSTGPPLDFSFKDVKTITGLSELATGAFTSAHTST